MDAANALHGHRPATQPSLSDRDREILEFERQWWKYAGAKETAVREKFDMSSTRYYQVLNALIDRPRRSRPTRCWSAGCAACAPPGSASAPPAASASSSDEPCAPDPQRSAGSPSRPRW